MVIEVSEVDIIITLFDVELSTISRKEYYYY
jgi:hypothetical protein